MDDNVTNAEKAAELGLIATKRLYSEKFMHLRRRALDHGQAEELDTDWKAYLAANPEHPVASRAGRIHSARQTQQPKIDAIDPADAFCRQEFGLSLDNYDPKHPELNHALRTREKELAKDRMNTVSI